jgi:hypothetical protein
MQTSTQKKLIKSNHQKTVKNIKKTHWMWNTTSWQKHLHLKYNTLTNMYTIWCTCSSCFCISVQDWIHETQEASKQARAPESSSTGALQKKIEWRKSQEMPIWLSKLVLALYVHHRMLALVKGTAKPNNCCWFG